MPPKLIWWFDDLPHCEPAAGPGLSPGSAGGAPDSTLGIQPRPQGEHGTDPVVAEAIRLTRLYASYVITPRQHKPVIEGRD